MALQAEDSPMHRLWDITELRTAIFELLEAKSEYASTARVCKAFWDTAVPFLWKEVKFEDTIGLFGDVVKYVYPHHPETYEMVCKTCAVCTKTLEENDFERYRLYARHMRKLVVKLPECQSFPALVQHITSFQPLWPNLHHLRLIYVAGRGENEFRGYDLSVFFTASLNFVTLRILDETIPGVGRLLDGIKRAVSNHVLALDTLDITMFSPTSVSRSQDMAVLAQIITTHSPTLRAIQLNLRPVFPLTVSQAIMPLPHLVSAHVMYLGATPGPYPCDSTSLRHLTVAGAAFGVKQLLESASAASLNTLELTIGDAMFNPLDPHDLPLLMSAVNRLDNLQVLTVRIGNWGGRVIPGYPLNTFYRTNRLWILAPATSEPLNAEDMETIARNMPQLTHFHIQENTVAHHDPNLTLHDLQILGKYCPGLQSITVNAVGRSSDLAKLEHPIRSVTVVIFHLSTTLIEPPEQLAEYIKHLFPNLRLGCSGSSLRSKAFRQSPWNDVWKLVGARDFDAPIWLPEHENVWRERI